MERGIMKVRLSGGAGPTVYVLSLVIIMMQGMCWSIMARGPCFSSPLRIPSECMYVSSLIFCEGERGAIWGEG